MQEVWVWSLGQEDPLEKEMVTHSSILAWEIPRREEPAWLQSKRSQRVGHILTTKKTSELLISNIVIFNLRTAIWFPFIISVS